MLRLLLVCLFVFNVRTEACPLVCTCTEHPYNDFQEKNALYITQVYCKTYAEDIVSSLSNETQILHLSTLSRKQLENVTDDLVRESINLQTLVISKSDATNFTFSLDSLRLEKLALVDSVVVNFPEINQNVSSLRTLDLSNNAVSGIQSDPFRTLTTLELLNLSRNALTNIGSNSLAGLMNLKCLDLSKNNLTTLDDKVLLPVYNLQYLNLSSNKLEVLNEVSFGSLVKLQQLDVSWNRLAHVAPGSLELPSLARLLLAGNPGLGGSREVLVGTGRRLQTVDASRTGLKQVPAALTHSIRTLRLAGNSIRIVRCGDLDSYPLLQLLDFTSNGLEYIEDDALGRLESLTILYLTDNDIFEIPKSLPEQLKVLHLERNGIKKVGGDDLQGLTVLEVLLLGDNKIRIVEEGAFSELTSLVTLDLSRNPVKFLQPGSLTGPSALEVLRLSSIGIVSPADEVSFPLSSPEHLISLDLSDSPGLARQFLADTAALAASKMLQELDISRSGVQFIRSDLLHFLPQLRVLHVKDNRLDCQELQWLGAWMRRQDLPEYGEITCNSPPELWGVPLIDLQEEVVYQTTTQSINENTIDSSVTTEHTTKEFNYTDLQDLNKIDIRKKTIHFILLRNNSVAKMNDSKENENKTVSTIVNVNNKVIENSQINVGDTKIFLNNTQDNKNKTKKLPERKKFYINKQVVKDVPHKTTESSITANSMLIQSQLLGVQNITASVDFENYSAYLGSILEQVMAKEREKNRQRTASGINNQPSKVAITETPASRLRPTKDRSHLEANANESYKSLHNKVGGVEGIASNLFIAPENNATHEQDEGKNRTLTSSTLAIHTDKEDGRSPYFAVAIILSVAFVGSLIILFNLAASFRRRKRRNAPLQDDIEVSSLPGVTELW